MPCNRLWSLFLHRLFLLLTNNHACFSLQELQLARSSVLRSPDSTQVPPLGILIKLPNTSVPELPQSEWLDQVCWESVVAGRHMVSYLCRARVPPLKLSSSVGAGIGTVFGNLVIGYARNPGCKQQLFTYAILGFALSEAMGLFCLMMAFLMLFAF